MLPIVLASAVTGLAAALGGSFLAASLDRANRSYEADLTERMERLGMRTDYVRAALRSRWLVALALAAWFWFGMGMGPVGVVAGLVSWRVVALVLEFVLERRRVRIRDQLVPACRGLATQVRGGKPLRSALAAVAVDLPDPLGGLLRRAVNEVSRGQSLREALTDLKERLQLDGMSILVISLIVVDDKGGENLTTVLDQISHSLEQAQRIERKRASDTAAGRLVVNILTATPGVFLGLYYFLDPEGTELVFNTVEGQVVLGLVGVLTFLGWRLASKILSPVE